MYLAGVKVGLGNSLPRLLHIPPFSLQIPTAWPPFNVLKTPHGVALPGNLETLAIGIVGRGLGEMPGAPLALLAEV